MNGYDKNFLALVSVPFGAAMVVLALWSAVIYVGIHFVNKLW